MVFHELIENEEYSIRLVNEIVGLGRNTQIQQNVMQVPIKDPSALMICFDQGSAPFIESFDPFSNALILIGEGVLEKNHQVLDGSNRILVENRKKDVYLFDRTGAKIEGFITYKGQWRIESYSPSYQVRNLTPAGGFQTVFMFVLKKIPGNGPALQSSATLSDEKAPRNEHEQGINIMLQEEYAHRCQICGTVLNLPSRGRYSMIHHLMPIETPHDGPSIRANMIVVCPNHQKEMQHGSFYIDPQTMIIHHCDWANRYHRTPLMIQPEHDLEYKYLEYHRDRICAGWIKSDLPLDKGVSLIQDRLSHLQEGLGSVASIIKTGESERVEFKASLRWDYTEERRNNALQYVVAKTIAGFMNARGGVLLIGVHDDRSVLGLNHDYEELVKKNRDGFELQLSRAVDQYIGRSYRDIIQVKFEVVDGQDVCIVWVLSSSIPAYIKIKDKHEFPVRMQNSTETLDPKDSEVYRKKRWPTS